MTSVQLVPIDKIRVINLRSRNKTKFREIVENISKVGLKKPITVSRRDGEDGFDLVCGQGRLEAFVACMESEGIHILETPPFLGPLLIDAGVLTRRGPSAQERKDIVLGRQIARQIAGLRIGQTVVLKRGTVVAVESVEGTDAAIRRGGALGRGGVVVVKVARTDQDLRFDLPTIGAETLGALREASATALALDAKRTLLVDREAFVAGANELDLAVVAE